MFCPKCGTKAIDDAGFCQKCGAKLIVDAPTEQLASTPPANVPQRPNPAPADTSRKKSKLPIIIGAVAAVVVLAIVFVALNWEGKTDYVASARAYTPYANSQGLPYTCGEVLDQYIPDAKWTVRETGNNAAFVDIGGTIKGMDAEVRITMQVEVNGDQFLVKSISVELDGREVSENTFFVFFVAYDEKLDDLSNLNELLSGKVDLTETYTDEAEGFSFKYPNEWVFNDMVDYGAYEDPLGFTSLCLISQDSPYVAIAIYKSSNTDLVKAFSNETEFLTAFGYTVNAVSEIEMSVVSLSGVPARKISYVYGKMSNMQDYLYVMGAIVYKVQLTCSKETAGSSAASFSAIMDSYTIEDTGGTLAGDSTDSDAVRRAYAEKVRELAAEDGDLQFALIDLTRNNAPELVAELSGYYVRVFAWIDGEVVPLGDEYWPYGAGGNNGYEYLPGQNVIRNFNSDQAGAIVYESYYGINFANEVDSLPIEQLSMWYFRDENGNGLLDENEPIYDEPIYYVGNTEVSADIYAGYQIPGDYEWIAGSETADVMLTKLNSKQSEDLHFVKSDDEYSTFTLHPDGTFSMEVNLFAGVGTLFGSYTMDEYSVRCYIETRSFEGFDGDDVMEFEMVFNEDRLMYVGESIGAVWNGSTFNMI